MAARHNIQNMIFCSLSVSGKLKDQEMVKSQDAGRLRKVLAVRGPDQFADDFLAMRRQTGNRANGSALAPYLMCMASQSVSIANMHAAGAPGHQPMIAGTICGMSDRLSLRPMSSHDFSLTIRRHCFMPKGLQPWTAVARTAEEQGEMRTG